MISLSKALLRVLPLRNRVSTLTTHDIFEDGSALTTWPLDEPDILADLGGTLPLQFSTATDNVTRITGKFGDAVSILDAQPLTTTLECNGFNLWTSTHPIGGISFWFYYSAAADTSFYIGGGTNFADCAHRLLFAAMVGGTHSVLLGDSGGNDLTITYSNTLLKLDSWNHVVIQGNATTGYAELYINRILAGSNTNANFGTTQTYSLVGIGYRLAGNLSKPVKVDHIRSFTKLLTSSEVALLSIEKKVVASVAQTSTVDIVDVFQDGHGVALWQFDSGAIETEVSGAHNLTTGTYVTDNSGKFGEAIDLTGLGDRPAMPLRPFWRTYAPIGTMSLWLYYDGINLAQFGTGSDTSWANDQARVSVVLDPVTSAYNVGIGQGNSGYTAQVSILPENLVVGWNHFVVVGDTSTHTADFYVNDTHIGSNTNVNFSTTYDETEDTAFGELVSDRTGIYDQVRYFTRALIASEITALYNELVDGSPVDHPLNLAGSYTFETDLSPDEGFMSPIDIYGNVAITPIGELITTKALYFPGTEFNFARFPRTYDINTPSLTIDILLRHTYTLPADNTKGLFSRGTSTAYYDREFLFSMLTTGEINLNIATTNTSVSATSTTQLQPGIWYRVTMVIERDVDARQDTVKVYINKTKEHEALLPANRYYLDLPVEIGRVTSGSLAARYFQGYMDNINWYRRALTDAEISNLPSSWQPYPIETHTGYTSASGTAYASDKYSTAYEAWEALCGIISGNYDSWASSPIAPTPASPKHWGYQTPVEVRLNAFRIFAPQLSSGALKSTRGIKDFEIHASNDGFLTHDVLHTGTYPEATALEWGPWVQLPDGGGTYLDHRLIINSNYGANPTEIQEIQLDMSQLI